MRDGTSILIAALFLGTAITGIHSRTSHAQSGSMILEGESVYLAMTDKVVLKIDDQVTDGCWPRPNTTKNAVELKLRNSGIGIVSEKGLFFTHLIIVGFGYESNGLCIVDMQLILKRLILATVPFSDGEDQTMVEVRLAARENLLTGPNSSMQKRLSDTAEEQVTAIILEIKKAQSDIFERFPDFEKAYLQYLEESN